MSDRSRPFFQRLASGSDAAITARFPTWGARPQHARAMLDVAATFAPLRHSRETGSVPMGQGAVDERLPWWDRLKMISGRLLVIHEDGSCTILEDRARADEIMVLTGRRNGASRCRASMFHMGVRGFGGGARKRSHARYAHLTKTAQIRLDNTTQESPLQG